MIQTWPKEVMTRTEEGLVCKHTCHFYRIKDESFAIPSTLLPPGPYTSSAIRAGKQDDFNTLHFNHS